MAKKNEEYTNIYNELDEHLSKILWRDNYGKGYTGYKNKLRDIKNNNQLKESFIIRRYFDMFKTFGYIRNEIVHKYKNKITITEEALEEIKKYLDILKNPPKVIKLFKRDVHTCSLNDSLSSVIKEMKDKIYTHIPVYDGNQFLELLTESSIIYWIEKYIDETWDLILENVKVKDVLTENPNDRYEFISQNTNIYEIKSMFEENIKDGERLGALLITNLWKKEEPLVGIITAWDLPTIDEYMH